MVSFRHYLSSSASVSTTTRDFVSLPSESAKAVMLKLYLQQQPGDIWNVLEGEAGADTAPRPLQRRRHGGMAQRREMPHPVPPPHSRAVHAAWEPKDLKPEGGGLAQKLNTQSSATPPHGCAVRAAHKP